MFRSVNKKRQRFRGVKSPADEEEENNSNAIVGSADSKDVSGDPETSIAALRAKSSSRNSISAKRKRGSLHTTSKRMVVDATRENDENPADTSSNAARDIAQAIAATETTMGTGYNTVATASTDDANIYLHNGDYASAFKAADLATLQAPLAPTPPDVESEQYIPLDTSDTNLDPLYMLQQSNDSMGESLMFEPQALKSRFNSAEYNTEVYDVHDVEYGHCGSTRNRANEATEHWRQLRKHLQTSLKGLQEQKYDMVRQQQQRQWELEQTQTTLQRYQTEMKHAGGSLEFYQKLRLKMAIWVGALRELREKVRPILDALYEIEAEVAAIQKWRDWEDDSIAILSQADLLDQVVGRQPSAESLTKQLTTIDEFGRDVKSKKAMEREKRTDHRARIALQRKQRQQELQGDESDAHTSDEERENLRQRHNSLGKALDVALGELDHDYIFLPSLIAVFKEWQTYNADDYKQTYASLSLADLASVLIETELCSLNDPWNESEGFYEAKWTTSIHKALIDGILDLPAMERLLEQSVLPAVSSLFAKNGYNIGSSSQTTSLVHFVQHLQKTVPVESVALQKIEDAVVSYIERELGSLAIAIVRKEAFDSTRSLPEQVQQAVHAASVSQMHRMKRILVNLLHRWGPLLSTNVRFLRVVLDFMCNKLLFLLSSLQNSEQSLFAASPADIYGIIWQELVPLGWLNNQEHFDLIIPLRAAARAYGLVV